jgi:thymidylate synthase (FAD)
LEENSKQKGNVGMNVGMNDAVKLLDHGHVRLVDHMGSDLSIVRSARVSYNAEWRSGEDEGKDSKLINYLIKNRHTTPFESVTFTFEVKAPIMVFRQWHRHRTWAYNEVSARYTELPEEYYIPALEVITLQSASNKQMRTDELHPQGELIRKIMRESNERSFAAYKQLLGIGCPRELARSVLPVATYSHMFATTNLHNMLHFLGLRCHTHAQHEIRVYAVAMLELIRPIVPVTIAAWEEHYNKK